MEWDDIIRSDGDRLFFVDPECFIIFTGDTLEDEQPFIRIGNWIDLPVPLIPLIENIIVPDLIIGNPALEQFNIDIRTLSTNRYIGSRLIVKKYMDFQKIYGLDLRNASVVDVEKDLPYLSKEKIISHRDSFIGIFYTDGNFRIMHNRNTLFSLRETEEGSYHDIRIHDILSRQSRDTQRYAGAGLVLVRNNPLFYRNRYFSSYMFPKDYYGDFSRLAIDPAQIREVLLPSSNFIHATKFIKWKNRQKGRVKLFSDNKPHVDLLQKLFSGATVVRQDFSAMEHSTGDGLGLCNQAGTYNLLLTYSKVRPSQGDITIAFIKGHGGIKDILKEKPDGIFITYSVFEDASLLFKSTDAPLVILSDGNPNISRLRGTGRIVLHPGRQYEFMNFDGWEGALCSLPSFVEDAEARSRIAAGNFEGLGVITMADAPGILAPERVMEIRNIISYLRIGMESSADRKTVSSMRRAVKDLESVLGGKEPEIRPEEHRTVLAFHGGRIYELFEKIEERTATGVLFPDTLREESLEGLYTDADKTIRAFYERITGDRRRLADLLALYAKKSGASVSDLEEAMAGRKRHYYSDGMALEGEDGERRRERFRKGRKIAAFVLIPLLLALLTWAGADLFLKYRKERAIQTERILREELIKKYGIHLSDRDIFTYANRVALANGYDPIIYTAFRKKNPHWIYPRNIFTMLDGEKVVVQEGDTLWDLSARKLMQRSIDFYRLIDRIREGLGKGEDIRDDLEQAKKLSFSRKHDTILDGITEEWNRRTK